MAETETSDRHRAKRRRGVGAAIPVGAARGGALLQRLAWWLGAVSVAVSVSGCLSPSENAAAIARGEVLAMQNCAVCHAVGPTDSSSFPDAPPFRAINFDYNAIMHERALARWHLGYVNMPPAEFSAEDVSDVGAYIRSLKQAAHH